MFSQKSERKYGKATGKLLVTGNKRLLVCLGGLSDIYNSSLESRFQETKINIVFGKKFFKVNERFCNFKVCLVWLFNVDEIYSKSKICLKISGTR